MAFQQKGEAARKLFRLIEYQKARIIGGFFFLFISSFVTLVIPIWLGVLIDKASDQFTSRIRTKNLYIQDLADSIRISNLFQFSAHIDENSRNLLLALFTILSIGAISNSIAIYLFESSSCEIGKRLRNCIFQSILRNRKYSEFQLFKESQKTTELSSRIHFDVDAVVGFSSQVLPDVFKSSMQLAFSLGILFYTSLDLSLILCLGVLPIVIIRKFDGYQLQETSRKCVQQFGKMAAFSSERLDNINTIHQSGQNVVECNRYFDLNQVLYKLNICESRGKAFFIGAFSFIGNMLLIGTFSYGGNLVMNDVITTGEFSSYLMYIGFVYISIIRTIKTYAQIQKSLVSSARIWTIISVKELKNDYKRIIEIKCASGLIQKYSQYTDDAAKAESSIIEFRNVDFAYPTYDANHHSINQKLLRNISLKVREGQSLGLIGRNDVGKTTLLSLITKLYEPKNDGIFWKGHPLSTIEDDFLRNFLVSSVGANNVLFNGSILENLIYGSNEEHVNMDRIKLACEATLITTELFEDKKIDIDFQVGEKGMNLTEVERRRVLVSRALYKNCPLLLIDRPREMLDEEAEVSMFESLRQYQTKVPITIIAVIEGETCHRFFDRVVELDSDTLAPPFTIVDEKDLYFQT